MRIMYILLLLLPAMTANGQVVSDHELNLNTPFEISGIIRHYQPGDGKNFILFRTWDIAGEIKDTSVPIDSRGYFKVKLWQPFEGDIDFIYQHRYVMLYATPGEKIGLEIDGDNWSENGNPLQSLKITGRSAATSRSIIDFQYNIDSSGLRTTPFSPKIPDEEYTAQRIADMKNHLAFLKQYIAERNLENTPFASWCENDIRYEAGYNIAVECFFGKVNSAITYKQLMNMLKDVPINSPAIHNSAYYRFIKTLATDFSIIVNVNDSIRQMIRHQRSSQKTASGKDKIPPLMTTIQVQNTDFPISLREASRYTNGFTKQLMYYNICASGEQIKNDVSEYAKIITDPVLLQLLKDKRGTLRKPFSMYDLVQHIKDYKVNDTFKRRLIKLLEAEKGHYVFMDFWGIWCGSCMADMPDFPAFIAQFEGEPIEFLFLAIQTDSLQVDRVKSKYGIQAKFVALTDDETAIMNNVMNFSAIPAQFVIDPSGYVVSNGINNSQVGYEDGVVNKTAVAQVMHLLKK